MEPISSTLNSMPISVSAIKEKSSNKVTPVAYNNIDFRSIINSEIGMDYIKDNNKMQDNLHKQISDAKQYTLDNHEYEKFVNNAKRVRPHRLNSKRFLKSFHPIPTGKKNPEVVIAKQEIDKSVLSNHSTKINLILEDSAADIKRLAKNNQNIGFIQQVNKYKEDQLLSNPGGDNFFLERQKKVIDNKFAHSTFSQRVGKDIFDSFSNLKNLVKNLGSGSEIKYLDKSGNIKTHRKVGFLRTVGNFFKNIASGLSFGAYTPDKEEVPVGTGDKIKHFFKKVFVQAMGKDLFAGVPQSMINVGEDALFAGLNLIETIPDATIGHTKPGRKITTQTFDNVQVAMDFATDIMPGGEASTRMKSFLFKKIKDLKTPWKKTEAPQYVRNTPFRKVIETLSFFMPFRI